MTARGVILGVIGVIFICGYSYFNDATMDQTFLVGNNMPFSIYGILILFMLFGYPLLKKIFKQPLIGKKEIVLAMTLTLAVCCIPGSGLMRIFPNSILLPHQYNKSEPGWKDQKVLDMVPARMMVEVGTNENKVVNGFIQGLRTGNKPIKFSDVPFFAWKKALFFWFPILLALWTALIGLSMMFHKQWADHEQLPYPIAKFSDYLLPDEKTGQSTIFHNKIFWLGAGLVLIFHMNNYLNLWFPNTFFYLNKELQFWGVAWKVLKGAIWDSGGWFLGRFPIYFSVIGIAYFLSSEVSLSLGIGPILLPLLGGFLFSYGISITANIPGISVSYHTLMLFGAAIGLFLVILYTGRHYYLNTIKQSLLIKTGEKVENYSVWGVRLFLIAITVFIILLSLAGFDWQLAILYALIAALVYTVMARIMAETGLFYIGGSAEPAIILWAVMGSQALGAQMLILASMFSVVLIYDTRESLMPFVINNFKMLDLSKIRIGKPAILFILALVLGFAVVIPVQLYQQYDRGFNRDDGWAMDVPPKDPFKKAVFIKQRLQAQGVLEESQKISGWQRFTKIMPYKGVILALCAGAFLVILFTFFRMRFPKWPLHPVLFLYWGTWPALCFYFSFLLGWLIKALVTKFGGLSIYQKLKPFMVGMIAGELSAALISSIIGLIYFMVTGEPPKKYMIFPG